MQSPRTLDEALLRIEELEALLLGPDLSLPKLGMTKTEWKVFLLLMRREIVSNDGIYTMLYGCDVDREPDITKIYVHKIRKKLGALGAVIRTKWGLGYFIAAEDKKRLRQLMEAESAPDATADAA